MKFADYVRAEPDLMAAIEQICARKAEALRDDLGEECASTKRIALFIPACKAALGKAANTIAEFIIVHSSGPPERGLKDDDLRKQKLADLVLRETLCEIITSDKEFLELIQLKVGEYLDGAKSLAWKRG